MTKTINIANLNQTPYFKKILREEAKKIVSEAGKNKFETWALNYLKKNYAEILPSTITTANVLDFLNGSKFKLSPEEFEARKKVNTSYKSLLNQYKTKGSLPDIDDEQDVGHDEEPLTTKQAGKKYASGEVPLDDIAAELGNITKMGVSKKIDDALAKLKVLGAGSDEGIDNTRIDAARASAANDYVKLLTLSKGNVNTFLKALEAAKLTNLSRDIGIVDNREKKAIASLYNVIKSSGPEAAKEMLIADLEDNDLDERLWKTYQAVVAKKANVQKAFAKN